MNEKKDKHIADESALSTKYKEGERVLCFEPDPTKVRVIYDAKILQISITADEKKNKSSPEFLVHFQGWNASWDRFVPQSYLLKVHFDYLRFFSRAAIKIISLHIKIQHNFCNFRITKKIGACRKRCLKRQSCYQNPRRRKRRRQ